MKIIAIVGASGSGKTTMSSVLKRLGIPTLVSYTTREMRDGEVDGVDHLFVTEDDLPENGEDLLAYTFFNGNHYWTEISQLADMNCDMCSYVVDEKGLLELKQNRSCDKEVISVLVKRSAENIADTIDKERMDRDNERESLPESEFDFVLENDGKFGEFEKKIEKMIKTIQK